MLPPGLSLIVPLYNEAHCIEQNLRALERDLAALAEPSWELLLVDDGSSDDTLERVRAYAAGRAEVRVLHHGPNRGKGFTVRAGVLASLGAEVLFADADLSTPLAEIASLRAARHASGAEVAIGSRALARSRLLRRQPWAREALGRLGNGAIRALNPELRDLRDTQCGFKLFEGAAARRIFAAARVERWGFDFEVLSLARRMGYSVVEVPVAWTHDEHSKVRAGDYLRTLADLLRVRWRARRGGYPGGPAPQ